MRYEQKSMSQALLSVFQEGLGDLDKSSAELVCLFIKLG